VRGRILYKEAGHQPFVVLRHDRSGLFFLAEDSWTERSACAGPFEPGDVLRAWRLANVRVPEGCERGPWQWGIEMLQPTPLPHAPDAWSRFEAAWLSPSVSSYSRADIDGVVNETCCAPPHDEPRVSWGKAPASVDLGELRRLAMSQCPDAADLGHAGLLERSWNAHPAGSLVLGRSAGSSVFVVVDLPPLASADKKNLLRIGRCR
jgi:hypothetical protein